MLPFVGLSFGGPGGYQGVTQLGADVLLCVHRIVIERPTKAIHERRHIKRLKTVRNNGAL